MKNIGGQQNNKNGIKHGMSATRVYNIWRGMKTRCTNPKAIKWNLYGGRGIRYDASWDTFEGFWNDMQEGYSDGLTLDRISSDGDYCKDNCRWVSYETQNNNKVNNIHLVYQENIITPKEIITMTHLPQYDVYKKIKQGWSVDQILASGS